MRFVTALILLSLLMSACVPEEDAGLELHDIALYSNASDLRGVYGYFYGEPTTLRVGSQGQAVTLSEGSSEAPLAVPNSLLVNEQPYLKSSLQKLSPPPTRVQRIPLTSDVELEVGSSPAAQEVVYFDGSKWFTLATNPVPTVGRRVIPRERLVNLGTLGELTRDEALALEQALAPRAPVAVTLLGEERVPGRRIGGLDGYRRTALYVQQTVPTDDAAYRPPAQELVWEVIDSGAQAVGNEEPSFQLITNDAQLSAVWNRAYGSRLTPPSLPDVNFRRETILAVFLATKPTGGYGLEVEDITLEGSDVYTDLRTTEPAEGAITTQALTTPWVLIRVLRGNVDAAWFRDAAGSRLIGVAQRTN